MGGNLPFHNNLVPVIESVDELREFLKSYPDSKFCLYLAYKDTEGWQKSTSRRYMNQVLPGFIYLPVNIQKDDHESLRQIYELSDQSSQIVAINQTQPHKSNPVLMDWFKSEPNLPTNVDAMIKDESGRLKPYDLNGPSFVGWFTGEVGSFVGKTVLLVGVGGVGEPIARRIIKDKPSKLLLVDPQNKEGLAAELSQNVSTQWYQALDEAKLSRGEDLIVLNAAGKEGATDQSGVYRILNDFSGKSYIFVDLRPQLEIDVVEKAEELGWRAFTGYSMNARNDYELLSKIAEVIDAIPPSFEEFKRLVAEAS